MTANDYNRLKRSARDIRASRAESFRRAAHGPSNAAAFAVSVLGRYGGSAPGRMGMLERVHRRLAFSVFLQRIYRQAPPTPANAVNLALTLNFPHSSVGSGTDAPQMVAPLARLVAGESSLDEHLRAMLLRRVRTESQVETLARQIVTRSSRTEERISASTRRVEAGGGSPSAMATGGASMARTAAATSPPPLPAISREYARGPAANGNRSSSAPEVPDEPATSITRRATPAGPPPVDVNELTEQVIRAIDQRIIAQRERMGRN
jgi:hypothetical protein